jgi:hypothetical protein
MFPRHPIRRPTARCGPGISDITKHRTLSARWRVEARRRGAAWGESRREAGRTGEAGRRRESTTEPRWSGYHQVRTNTTVTRRLYSRPPRPGKPGAPGKLGKPGGGAPPTPAAGPAREIGGAAPRPAGRATPGPAVSPAVRPAPVDLPRRALGSAGGGDSTESETMWAPRTIVRPRVRFSSCSTTAADDAPGAAGLFCLRLLRRNSSVSARTRFMCLSKASI